jgi:hypothetical protein
MLTFARHYILLLLLSCATHSADGQLAWDTKDASITAKLDDKTVSAVFKFKNAGSSAITISKLEPSCGCTTTQLAKTEYKPGESGALDATIHVALLSGAQSMRIAVTSNDPSQPFTILNIAVAIPPVLEVDPNLVTWQKGSEATKKIIKLKVVYPSPVYLAHVSSSNDVFVTKLTTILPGREYQVEVYPLSTANGATSRIRLSGEIPGKKFLYAVARID